MKKMTRFLALVTVLVLMLSMSVTAFAIPKPLTHNEATGTCKEVVYKDSFYCYHSDGTRYQLRAGDVIKKGASFYAPESPKKIILDGRQVATRIDYPDNDVRVTSITADTLTGGAILPQPKTGVMDTLPLWFGIMAVSACAYVLTSKKKVF